MAKELVLGPKGFPNTAPDQLSINIPSSMEGSLKTKHCPSKTQ